MNDLPTAYSAKTHKARRKHQCCECRGVIQPGEKYHLFSGCYEGRWEAFKTCADCEALRDSYCREHELTSDERPAFGWLGTTLTNETNPWPDRFLSIQAKRRTVAPPPVAAGK